MGLSSARSEGVPQVAVIGAGYWGKNLVRNFHGLNALRAICDSDPERLESFKQQYPSAKMFHAYSDVLRDTAIRGVAIATPAEAHADAVREALLAGKDVFVEKPLCLSVEDGEELVALAKRKDRILMVGHLLWYHPAVLKLKELIAVGELGRIQYIYSNRLNLGKIRREENILWSFAPHDISVILGLLNEMPDNVRAQGGNYLHQQIADVTISLLAFPSGVKAHIFVSWLHPFKEQKLVVVGDRKMAVFDDTAREGKLKIYDKGIEWRAGLPVPRQTAETTLFFDETEPVRLECEHFLACVRDRTRPTTDGPSALRVLRVLDASQRSLERGGLPVSLDEPAPPIEPAEEASAALPGYGDAPRAR